MFSLIAKVLRLTNWLNWIVAVLLIFLFSLMLFGPASFHDALFNRFAEGPPRETMKSYLFGLTLLLVPCAIGVHFILTRLSALVLDAAKGAAFTETSAKRLRSIGWALLAINIADLVFGWLSTRASAATGEYFGWSFSLTGWIAVPMLFVLAHVFREGAAMREDLEGTV
ncbi:MAG: DUF2975 domain-containing protein [Erythrobacter sp.]|jgi:hypothetical protein